jgi:hypothetical protein
MFVISGMWFREDTRLKGVSCVPLRIIERLTLNLLTTTIVAPPSNASKWQMGFNSAFKGLTQMACIQGVSRTPSWPIYLITV